MLIPQQLVDKLKLLQVAAVTGFLTSWHSGSSQSRWAITYPGHHRRLSSRPWSVQPDDPPLYCLTQHQPQGVRWQLKVGGTLVGDNNDSACRREEELLPARCKSHKFVHPSVWNVANKHLRCGGVKVLGVRAQGCLHPPPEAHHLLKGHHWNHPDTRFHFLFGSCRAYEQEHLMSLWCPSAFPEGDLRAASTELPPSSGTPTIPLMACCPSYCLRRGTRASAAHLPGGWAASFTTSKASKRIAPPTNKHAHFQPPPFAP